MSEPVEVTVAAGRTLEVDGRRMLPGERVTLPAAEVALLQTAGFVVHPTTGEQPAPRRF